MSLKNSVCSLFALCIFLLSFMCASSEQVLALNSRKRTKVVQAQKKKDFKLRILIEKSEMKSLNERLRLRTEILLNSPYKISPLGEGRGIDKDPLSRFDAFDCTTFVETSIALTYAQNIEEVEVLLNKIRYKGGAPNFAARRHFPESEWIPDLHQKGILHDSTREIAGDEAVEIYKDLDLKIWKRRRHKFLTELKDDRIPVGRFKLPMWPLDKAILKSEQIPEGTVLNVVRVNFRKMPVRVSHQGVVIRKKNKLYMRHAADRKYHRVVDEPLKAFLVRMSKYKKWPVAGIHLMKIQERPENL